MIARASQSAENLSCWQLFTIVHALALWLTICLIVLRCPTCCVYFSLYNMLRRCTRKNVTEERDGLTGGRTHGQTEGGWRTQLEQCLSILRCVAVSCCCFFVERVVVPPEIFPIMAWREHLINVIFNPLSLMHVCSASAVGNAWLFVLFAKYQHVSNIKSIGRVTWNILVHKTT